MNRFAQFSPAQDEAETAASDPFASLPPGFRIRPLGIEFEDGEQWSWLCSPLTVLALPHDGLGRGWGRLIEVIDPDGRAHRWAMPAALLAGDGREIRAALLNIGCRIASGTKARNRLTDLLAQWQPDARATTTDRLGWADETCRAFVLGDGRVLGDGNVVYQTESSGTAASEMKPASDLKRWRDAVAARCVGNPLLVLGVSLAFAGPLLDPLGIDGGGVHLRGASSRGKSTIQRVAVSVWGSPRFKQSWRATDNGLEGLATVCNGSLLTLDELAEIEPRAAGKSAYMLANGAGKARANRYGGTREAARWRVLILSSGEISLADKMAEAGQRAAAGQAVRLLDLAADGRTHGAFDDLHGAANGATFADRLGQATAQAYGTAGPAFVNRLLADLEDARAQVREVLAGFAAMARDRFDLSDEGQIARAVDRFALIAAAGELATAWGLTGWPEGTARDAALEALRLWLHGRGGGASAEARDAVDRTRAFLTAHGAARFETVDGSDDRPVINRAGWKKDGTFFVSTDIWKEIHRGADPARSARHVRDAGFLLSGDRRNLTTRLGRKVEGRPRTYAVTSDILGGAGDD